MAGAAIRTGTLRPLLVAAVSTGSHVAAVGVGRCCNDTQRCSGRTKRRGVAGRWDPITRHCASYNSKCLRTFATQLNPHALRAACRRVQLATPPGAMDLLVADFGVSIECFASPLNRRCSACVVQGARYDMRRTLHAQAAAILLGIRRHGCAVRIFRKFLLIRAERAGGG